MSVDLSAADETGTDYLWCDRYPVVRVTSGGQSGFYAHTEDGPEPVGPYVTGFNNERFLGIFTKEGKVLSGPADIYVGEYHGKSRQGPDPFWPCYDRAGQSEQDYDEPESTVPLWVVWSETGLALPEDFRDKALALNEAMRLSKSYPNEKFFVLAAETMVTTTAETLVTPLT